jgi:hypothetical protein
MDPNWGYPKNQTSPEFHHVCCLTTTVSPPSPAKRPRLADLLRPLQELQGLHAFRQAFELSGLERLPTAWQIKLPGLVAPICPSKIWC